MKLTFLSLVFWTAFSLPTIVLSQVIQPQVWLKADSLTKDQTVWQDESGSAYNATCGHDSLVINEAGLNYNKAIYFDGSGTYFQVPYNIEILSHFTIISVFHSADTTERGLWGSELPGQRLSGLTTRRVLGPEQFFDAYKKCEQKPTLNRVEQQWGPTPAVDGDSIFMALGSFCGVVDTIVPFKGYMAEFMIFDHLLESVEKAQVETYLALKYGITLEEGNYVSSAREVLWNRKEDSLYAFHIAGIGRDDNTGLYQKQASSASEKDLLAIGLDSIVSTNTDNKSVFGDKKFLIWGNNGAPLSKVDSSEALITPLQRQWKMKRHKFPYNKYTQLQLDLKQVADQDSLEWWLIIDRSGKGDFAPGAVAYILYDTLTADSIAVFNNVIWDNDGSGSDVFSFGQLNVLSAEATIISEPICSYSDEGAISITTSGGQSPFRYVLKDAADQEIAAWSDSDSTGLENLKGGSYELIVNDAVGQEVILDLVINSPEELVIDLGEDRVIGNNGKYKIDVAEQVPDTLQVTYNWESDNNFSSTSSKVTIRDEGLYKLSVTTDLGCIFSDSILLTEEPLIKFAVTPSLVINGGGQVNIHILYNEPTDIRLALVDAGGTEQWAVEGVAKRSYNFSEVINQAGAYHLVLTTDNGSEIRKVIVVQ